MQKKLQLTLAATLVAALTSCGKLGELSADLFTVTPSPLEASAGKVPVTINGRFPEKYMQKKAEVTVVPVLRYRGGEKMGQPATFQGEKVIGNNQEISYKLGGNYTMRTSFDYIPEMEKSELYLVFDAKLGKKAVNLHDVKVADGVIATSDLVSRTVQSASTCRATDAYQYSIAERKQAQIKYLISQAKVRTSELKTTSVQDFIKILRDIKADQNGFQIDNIEVSAYASPDGSTDLNTRLAKDREKSSSDYVRQQLKDINLEADLDTKYTAEDWEGFQELVAASNIQDKDVILRVLSMYPDPEEREKQIRNISVAYKELADEILPELRRARLTVNYNIIGRSDDDIAAQLATDASKLSLEELLYAASLEETADAQANIYKKAAELYPNDYRAYNNLAEIAYSAGRLSEAKDWLSKAAALNNNAAEVNANRALVALAEGDYATAEGYLGRATTAKNYNEVLGNLQVAQGNYQAAARSLEGANTNTAALAQILNKDYEKAARTLQGVKQPNGTTSYLKAVIAARTGMNDLAVANLSDAISKDASLRQKAANDLEFQKLRSLSAFQSLIAQ